MGLHPATSRRDGGRYHTSPRSRVPAVLVAGAFQLVLAFVLVRGLAPGLAGSVVEASRQTLAVTFSNKPPSEPVVPQKPAEKAGERPRTEGASAQAGKQARAKPVAAPRPPVAIEPTALPPVSGDGEDAQAGAAPAGEGTGAGGAGLGPGGGRQGLGQGGGGTGVRAVKIAGDINSARDYPRKTRDLRIGHSVIIDLGVGRDGRVSSCHIVRPSPDAAADRITCELAQERFRFRPATDGAGNPVPATFRWQQRWFVR